MNENENPRSLVRVRARFVRDPRISCAESRAAARNIAANGIITVERSEQDELLGVTRDQIIVGLASHDQMPLAEPTAADAMEASDEPA